MLNWKSKIYFPNTLSFRIFIFFWLSFFLFFGLILVLPFLFNNNSYLELSQKDISVYHNEIVDSIRTKELTKIINGVDILSKEETTDDIRPILVDKQGLIWGAKENEVPFIREFMVNSANQTNPLQKIFYNTLIVGPFVIHLELEQKDPYFIYFVSKINPQQEIVELFFDNPIFIFLFIMFISTPILWGLSHSISKPLRNLQNATQMVASGHFSIDKSLEESGTVELREVGKSFNHMTEALDSLISHQKVLLSSISHELRTPLTRLQLSLALLRRTEGDSTILQRIEKESKLIDKMVNDILLLSRQQLNSHLTCSIFLINELLIDIFDNIEFEASQKKIDFNVIWEIDVNQKYMINGNEELLDSAIENVIRNALKYTKSYLEVKVRIEDGYFFISVDDNGEGIPESEYQNIFRPFYRVDEARTINTGGVGLGLAIVDNIVTEHQGKVWAEKSHLGGLRVSIRLPLWL
ncbi:two-component system sensor histidine kinase CpxA [Bisgaardia hudsonensis]|uniref:histidine kinase n=1 Tax=Bisgaardia hudsonensis TaxID=109472 RepID=A0A4R2MUL1_9PAST|nr:envelope stress sensor histidine kinase CpxA [Bisgaardia hudsonensis]QLB12333.1 two-component system sensor histidine kinase CpxA [Bisgaardia hudsonensis]TCP12380.1 two-component system sensor histidine kinase CpxA [Bisgaardia hudsonensis]